MSVDVGQQVVRDDAHACRRSWWNQSQVPDVERWREDEPDPFYRRSPSDVGARGRLVRLWKPFVRLRRYGLIIIDEVGYLPFEQDAANLVFELVSSRYEHTSLILTSNLPFSSWGGVFGDQAVAAAMIDRIVHHADVLTVKGASYRLRNRGIDTLPSIRAATDDPDN